MTNVQTIRPASSVTLPPSAGECAYGEILSAVRTRVARGESVAWAVVCEVANLDPSCRAELAPRLYDAVTYGGKEVQ